MSVLVDSSVWIDYFRGGKKSVRLDELIGSNTLCINDLILAELVPFLKIKGQSRIIRLLNKLRRIDMDTEWSRVIACQTRCLEKGINGIGIPDLLIIDQVIRHDLQLYTLDKHFSLVARHVKINLWDWQ